MPNWIYNSLKIVGPSREALDVVLKRIRGRANGQTISFTRIVPHPKQNMNIKNGPGPDGKQKWCDWNKEHWGTIWDACDCEEPRITGTTAEVSYRTANSDSCPVINALSWLFPDCSFELGYGEGEDEWHGVSEFKAGLQNETKYYDGEIGFGWTCDEILSLTSADYYPQCMRLECALEDAGLRIGDVQAEKEN